MALKKIDAARREYREINKRVGVATLAVAALDSALSERATTFINHDIDDGEAHNK